jgi:hypothetical protein
MSMSNEVFYVSNFVGYDVEDLECAEESHAKYREIQNAVGLGPALLFLVASVFFDVLDGFIKSGRNVVAPPQSRFRTPNLLELFEDVALCVVPQSVEVKVPLVNRERLVPECIKRLRHLLKLTRFC